MFGYGKKQCLAIRGSHWPWLANELSQLGVTLEGRRGGNDRHLSPAAADFSRATYSRPDFGVIGKVSVRFE